MPNCPVCGKEVQSTTAYCPAGRTSLKQTSPSSSAQSGTYAPNYYSPQPNPGMPTANHPHSHRKYILAIIVVALIGLIVGGLVTTTFLIGPDVTDVTGTVSLGSLYVSQSHATPNHILFNSALTRNLTSRVFPCKSYQ